VNRYFANNGEVVDTDSENYNTSYMVLFNTVTRLGSSLASQGFSAIGSEPRLSVLVALVKAGREGLTVGEIRERIGMPPSTMAHHLRILESGKLIRQERRGRAVLNFAVIDHIEALAAFLLKECCQDEIEIEVNRNNER